MFTLSRSMLMCAALLLAVATVQAQSPEQAQPLNPAPDPATSLQASGQQPTLTVTTHEVLLDVVVTDAKHHPVTGLTSADFHVTEESDPQTLRQLREHSSLSAEDVARLKSRPALPPNTFTNFTPVLSNNAYTVVLLDAMDTPMTAQMYLREQLVDFLKKVQPGTPIAIFQLDSEMRLIQGFSADPKTLLAAAASKRDMPSFRKPFYGSPALNQLAKSEVLSGGMQSMGRYLAGFPGRKNLVWFTAHLPFWYGADNSMSSLEEREGRTFRDDSYLQQGMDGLTDELRLSRVAVYPIDARGLQTLPGFDASRRSPGGNGRFLTAQAFQHMDLDSIAEATGGKAYYNTNDLKGTLGEIIDNGSNYYALAYSTTNKVWKGQFRRVKVTVDRPGVSLQYRKGYFAVDRSAQEQRQFEALQRRLNAGGGKPYTRPADDTAANGDKTATIHKPKGGFDAAMDLGAIPPTEILFTANLTMGQAVTKLKKDDPLPKDNYLRPEYRTKPFRDYAITIHTDARTVNATLTPDGIHHGAIQFVTAVYDQQGVMVNSLSTTAQFDMHPETYRNLLAAGVNTNQVVAIPVRGNYFVRIGIHDLGNDHVGALEIPVDEVQPATAQQASSR